MMPSYPDQPKVLNFPCLFKYLFSDQLFICSYRLIDFKFRVEGSLDWSCIAFSGSLVLLKKLGLWFLVFFFHHFMSQKQLN